MLRRQAHADILNSALPLRKCFRDVSKELELKYGTGWSHSVSGREGKKKEIAGLAAYLILISYTHDFCTKHFFVALCLQNIDFC